ncbi:MAG TPA: hypothetical protein VM659_14675, partial [Dongiaceae bacterium]|nr:hypothetical protein [Dongiaceae bacterium]
KHVSHYCPDQQPSPITEFAPRNPDQAISLFLKRHAFGKDHIPGINPAQIRRPRIPSLQINFSISRHRTRDIPDPDSARHNLAI